MLRVGVIGLGGVAERIHLPAIRRVHSFTLAGACDLMLISAEGGQFCGPATVARSQAHSDPFAAYTELVGAGPLLVVAPSQREQLQIEDAEMVDGEVVE